MSEKQWNPLVLEPGVNTDKETVIKNICHNVENYKDVPYLDFKNRQFQPEEVGKRLLIVAGGPSLKRHIDEIKVLAKDSHVLALNNTYSYLIENGVMPDYFMLLDSRQDNVKFLEDVFESSEAGALAREVVTHFIGVQCAPNIFNYLEQINAMSIVKYMTAHPYNVEHVNDYDIPDEAKFMIGGPVGTVGIKSISLGTALGYKIFHLFGYDSSYEDGEHHAYKQELNDGANTIEVKFDGVGKTYITTPTLANQATEFTGFIKEVAINYNAEFFMHSEGLLPDLLQYNIQRGATDLKEREKLKYEQMWQIDAYRS